MTLTLTIWAAISWELEQRYPKEIIGEDKGKHLLGETDDREPLFARKTSETISFCATLMMTLIVRNCESFGHTYKKKGLR